MAKEVAISKRIKISEAQEHMILAVLGASLVLGVAIALISHFAQQISFNAKVIMAEDESIVAYSNIIETAGVCTKPNGAVYSDSELDRCDPDSIEVSQIPGTLRANILENLAANDALNSVPKEGNSGCTDANGKTHTYKDLMENYSNARGSEQLQAASNLIKSCSALRVIPDALPAFKNEEALLASLNKLYNDSNWVPESISPSGSTEVSKLAENLNEISVSSVIEANSSTTLNVLNNIERSIREFDINSAIIEWGGSDTLNLQFHATAYYVNESTITESTTTITPGGKD
ncbi:hypothetical protein IJH01_03270 [Candidatus Saccharibacteria bacterium]|nr:hypothetical protein [Candidatus Saccharibacteria bacterium]